MPHKSLLDESMEIFHEGRPYLSKIALCIRYDISESEFREMLCDGMPHIRVGKRPYINISDFQAWNRGEYPSHATNKEETT